MSGLPEDHPEATPIPEARLIGESAIRILRHELRTPVNHIVGYSEMLIDEAGDTGYGELVPILRDIQNAGKQLLARINIDLDPAVSAGHVIDLAVIRHDLNEPLDNVIARSTLLQAHAEKANNPALAADLRKINAAAWRLHELLRADSDLVSIAEGGEAAPGGTASESQNMVRALESSRAARPVKQVTPGQLLIVDDIANNRDMLARRLERLGYSVAMAENGRQALEIVRTAPFDLILLDIMMPEMNGYQVLEHLKADAELRHIPVIVLSALDEIESVVRCIEIGAADYLPKPFDPVLLNARISACLEQKRLRDKEVTYLHQIEISKKRADDLLHVVIPIGVALSAEKNYNRLLENIVLEAMALCNSDAGSLYLRTDDDLLKFVILRNRSLGIALGGANGEPIPFKPLRMYEAETGQPNRQFVVTQTALGSESILITDAYNAEGFDFSGTRAFDQQTGYRSMSFLTVPLRDDISRVIGVLQLINAQNTTGTVVPFDQDHRQMIESLSTLAAAALTVYDREQRLRQQIENLRIEIDEAQKKRQVAQITETDYFQSLRARARELRSAHEPATTTPPSTPAAPAPSRTTGRVKKIYMIGEQPLSVVEEGGSNRQVVILIHGWSSSWYALSPLLPMLSKRYRCLAVDLPGYGDSPPLPERASMVGYADLLADLIRQVSNEPVILVGHSMGGMISLTMALRHPSLIERMVLVCPTISGHLSRWINIMISPITALEQFRITNWLVAALEPQMMSVTDRLMRPASFAERTSIADEDYRHLRDDARRPGQGRVRAECFRSMREGDLRGKLSQIQLPSLVLWGMEDNTVPLRDASVVADEWPSAELRVIPKAGHWPQFEIPDVTERYIRAFLSTPIKLLKVQF